MTLLTVMIAEFRGIWVSMNGRDKPTSVLCDLLGLEVQDENGNPPPAWRLHNYASVITALLSSGQSGIFCYLGHYLARKLEDWENWRTSTQYVDHLITKLCLLEFANRFNVFAYVAFVKAKTA